MAGAPVFVGPIWRYSKHDWFSSAFDPLDDLVAHLDFLCARDFVVELLVTQHGIHAADARRRAERIRPHVQLAAKYIGQARSSATEVSFVSCYYGALNLIKVCILASPLHQRLATNRLHGASYDPTGKLSRSLPAETITVQKSGAIPLFYELLTGRTIQTPIVVRMDEVYPYISDVSAEWDQARRRAGVRFRFNLGIDADEKQQRARYWVDESDTRRFLHRQIPAFTGVKRDRNKHNSWVAKAAFPLSVSQSAVLLNPLNRRFLYYPIEGSTTTAAMFGPLLMPEEIPLVLAFYHLSSVARYNPEFLERLSSSKYWPVVSAMRPHAIHKFLLLFWSYMRQANVAVQR